MKKILFAFVFCLMASNAAFADIWDDADMASSDDWGTPAEYNGPSIQEKKQKVKEDAAVARKAAAERKAKEEADRKVKEEAERKAKLEAERKAKEEAERKAKLEAERKAKEEADRKAKLEAERKAKEDADRKAKLEAERKAKEEADRKAKLEAERKAKQEADRKAKEEENKRKAAEAEKKDAQAKAAAQSAAEKKSEQNKEPSGGTKIHWVPISIGAAVSVAGGVMTYVFDSKAKDVTRKEPANKAEYEKNHDDAGKYQTYRNISMGIAAAGLVCVGISIVF